MAAKKKAKKKVAPVKVSSDLGHKALAILKLKAKISKANKVVADLKSECSPLEKEFITLMEEQKGVTRIDVKLGSLTLKKDDVFAAKDWSLINNYVQDTGDFGIYQKRLSGALLKEYFEDGVIIAGIEHATKKTLGVGFKRG